MAIKHSYERPSQIYNLNEINNQYKMYRCPIFFTLDFTRLNLNLLSLAYGTQIAYGTIGMIFVFLNNIVFGWSHDL